MTDKAAIKADYIDKHYMKTTGAVRFVFEVSKENAAAAEAVMGLPAHGGNKWCAIALIATPPAFLRRELEKEGADAANL